MKSRKKLNKRLWNIVFKNMKQKYSYGQVLYYSFSFTFWLVYLTATLTKTSGVENGLMDGWMDLFIWISLDWGFMVSFFTLKS